jgi:hypothetical protein
MTNTPCKPTVVLNLGMGVESSAILARLVLELAVRDFDLSELVVVTSMTGDEFESTRRLVETYLLPLLRAHGVRYVQVARRAAAKERGTAGYVVLDDSTAPARVHLEGRFKLSDELAAAGTVATTAGSRLCSCKSKGEPIDEWLRDLVGDDWSFRQMIGFNRDEMRRVREDSDAGAAKAAKGVLAGRKGTYPLVEWGWSRADCLAYLARVFNGVTWLKSCCGHCPFAKGRPEVVARFRDEPAVAADAMWLEHLALALNPRMALYESRTLHSVLEADGNAEALRRFAERLERAEWAVYRVRRLYRAPGLADRCVEVLHAGTRAGADEALNRLALAAGVAVVEEAGSRRAWLRRKPAAGKRVRRKAGTEAPKAAGQLPAEEFLVACPHVPEAKAGRGFNEEKWSARVGLPLAA